MERRTRSQIQRPDPNSPAAGARAHLCQADPLPPSDLPRDRFDRQIPPKQPRLPRLLEGSIQDLIRLMCDADAEAILLLGPGEAKRELEKRLRDEGFGKRIVAVETVDKMSDHQIAARARQRFPK